MAIVVVEDDDDVRTAVQEILQEEGYVTVGAANGRVALEVLRSSRTRPCMILFNMMMPVMDGWEFLMRIDQEADLHLIPVAIMSAHPSIRPSVRQGSPSPRRLDAVAPTEAAELAAASFHSSRPLFGRRLFGCHLGIDVAPTPT